MLRWLNANLLYPLTERWQRRGIRACYHRLQTELCLPLAERLKLQRRRLVKTLSHAGGTVPYYRDLFKQLNFHPEAVAWEPELLTKLPFLDKDTIREQGDRLLSESYPREGLHPRKTGGSTGPSVVLHYDNDSLDHTAAVNRLVQQWAGRNPSQLEVHLSSSFPESISWQDQLKEQIKCLALNRRNIMTASLDEVELHRVWKLLHRWRPRLLHGHPSTLYALACFVRRNKLTGQVAEVFESTGEVLFPHHRQAIEEHLGCQVVNRYGSAEFGVTAYEASGKPEGPLRVLETIVYAENRCGEGGENELVLTGLTTPAMPLIRYRTGDNADVVRDEIGQPHLKTISGRVHDIVEIAGQNYPTHYLQDVLDRYGDIDDFQIELKPRNQPPVLRLVPREGSDTKRVTTHLRDMWGNQVDIRISARHELRSVGRRGKFRHVVAPGHDEAAAQQKGD